MVFGLYGSVILYLSYFVGFVVYDSIIYCFFDVYKV